jgi:hypothetical protein
MELIQDAKVVNEILGWKLICRGGLLTAIRIWLSIPREKRKFVFYDELTGKGGDVVEKLAASLRSPTVDIDVFRATTLEGNPYFGLKATLNADKPVEDRKRRLFQTTVEYQVLEQAILGGTIEEYTMGLEFSLRLELAAELDKLKTTA